MAFQHLEELSDVVQIDKVEQREVRTSDLSKSLLPTTTPTLINFQRPLSWEFDLVNADGGFG